MYDNKNNNDNKHPEYRKHLNTFASFKNDLIREEFLHL